MSTLEVKVVKVEIENHPNADRLSVARINGQDGFVCIVGLNEFKDGDLVIYIPSDSLLPQNIMDYREQTKIHMTDNRLRAIKIRGIISEGLCLDPSKWLPEEKIKEGEDVTELLDIKKYEPKISNKNPLRAPGGMRLGYKNKNFPKYTNIERIEKSPGKFDGRDVVVTKKIHGSNWRAGYIEKDNIGLFKGFMKKFFGISYKEFLVGTHNTIRFTNNEEQKNKDAYWKIAIKYDIEGVCKRVLAVYDYTNIVFYGELYGPKIQKGYGYGVESDNFELRIFDIMLDGEYIAWDKAEWICEQFCLPTVEVVYCGKYYSNILALAQGVDEYGEWKGKREGIVIKTCQEEKSVYGRRIAKKINSEYILDKNNTEYH